MSFLADAAVVAYVDLPTAAEDGLAAAVASSSLVAYGDPVVLAGVAAACRLTAGYFAVVDGVAAIPAISVDGHFVVAGYFFVYFPAPAFYLLCPAACHCCLHYCHLPCFAVAAGCSRFV